MAPFGTRTTHKLFELTKRRSRMVVKNWKRILLLTVLVIVSTIAYTKGGKYLEEDDKIIVSSLCFAGVILTGMRLWMDISMDTKMKKPMETETRELTEAEKKEMEKWAGKLEIENEEVIFSFGEEQIVKIRISDIKAIGEFTTAADPIAIDWYLIIVNKDHDVIYIPVFAVGLQDVLEELSQNLNHEIVHKLFASIKFDSNVIYPKSVDGEKLFHLKGLNPDDIWGKLKLKIGFGSVTPILREEIVGLKED